MDTNLRHRVAAEMAMPADYTPTRGCLDEAARHAEALDAWTVGGYGQHSGETAILDMGAAIFQWAEEVGSPGDGYNGPEVLAPLCEAFCALLSSTEEGRLSRGTLSGWALRLAGANDVGLHGEEPVT